MQEKKIKWIVVFVVIAACIGGGYYYYSAKQTVQPTVTQTAVVERGKITSTVSATGTIKPLNSVEISSKVTARLKEVMFKENDVVKAGQTVAVLDSTTLQTQLDQAKYKVTNTEAKYKRLQYLNSIGAKSDADLEDALLSYQTAVLTYAGVQSDVNDTIIVSPMDGVVIGEPKIAGTMITAGVTSPTVIMTVADMSTKQINAKVDETDIGKVKIGQKATFTVDAYSGRTFTATVSNISQTDVGSTWSSSTSTTTVIYYSVTLDIDDPENLLKPAMTARVNIHTAEKEGALMIPLSALKTNNDGQYVVLAHPDGTTENRSVTIGLYSDDKVEITDGLSEGDTLSISYTKSTSKSSSSSKDQGGPPPR
ncbi:efflux RND transporter periplasmic adaptor subunit [Anaerosinus massiliensis]|uniref:efflux RND transporter periplasmic adaptor subunit n=1 Tax=Massilibacillus massiliensis TaxID=1806837 RepID=UPI000DA6110F|nr:efflux RND transporter periplasmic adaptor subunit [Massilibacillus massiliensis]